MNTKVRLEVFILLLRLADPQPATITLDVVRNGYWLRLSGCLDRLGRGEMPLRISDDIRIAVGFDYSWSV